MSDFQCIRCGAAIQAEFKACPYCGEPITDFVREYAQAPIDGKYRIVSRLGAGGMGEVYRAEHVHLHTTRVIKLMRTNLSAETNAHERFLREARLATRIHHPNVATLHDFSTLPDGTYYMVWEFIEGKNLTEVLRRDRAFSPQRAATLGVQILNGLEAVHRAGIIHRDISPDNIMLTMEHDGRERAKIIDLGIAKGGGEEAGQTQTGVFIGKLRYCSPEHLGLLPEGEKMDGRADLYSFGIVLYEMVAGAPPFAEETPQQYILSHTKKAPRPLRTVNPSLDAAPELEAVIFKALEKDREKRFASAKEFARALEQLIPTLSDEPVVNDRTMVVPTPAPAALPAHAVTAVTDSVTPDRTLYVPEKTAASTSPRTLHQQPVTQPDTSLQSRAAETVVAERKSSAPVVIVALVAMLFLGGVAAAAYLFFTRGESPRPETIVKKEPVTPPTDTAANRTVVPTSSVAPMPPSTDLTVQPPPTTTADTTATATTAPPQGATPATTTQAPRPQPARTPRPEPARPPETATSAPPPATTTEVAQTETVAPSQPQQRGGIRGLLRRPGRALVDTPEYKGGFQRGIIPDYSALSQGSSVQWIYVAPGVNLAQYKVRVNRFRNLTPIQSDGMMSFLENDMQTEIDGVTTGSRGTLNADGAVYWAENSPGKKRGVGIEMIFRDSSGKIVAMLRHRIFENSPEDAAEEMPEAVAEFIEENR